jgi:hypothetical protein
MCTPCCHSKSNRGRIYIIHTIVRNVFQGVSTAISCHQHGAADCAKNLSLLLLRMSHSYFSCEAAAIHLLREVYCRRRVDQKKLRLLQIKT